MLGLYVKYSNDWENQFLCLDFVQHKRNPLTG